MRKAYLMESIQPWIEKFIKQAQQQRSQSTKDYPTSYRNLRVKLSFGYGNFTSIPWFAFLGEGQEASLPPHLSEASSSTFWQFTIQIQILLLFNIQTG